MSTFDPNIDEIPIGITPTPNPDALMFRVHEALVPTGTFEYELGADTTGSPLAAALFEIAGLELVLIAPRFVTVRKHPEAAWPALVAAIKDVLRRFISSGEMAVMDQTVSSDPSSETERRIIEILENEIRPALAGDGGDVTYLAFVDGVVQVRLLGACGTCPSAITTLKMGIERLLMEMVPEVKAVESVA